MDPVIAFITLKTIFINSITTYGHKSVIMVKYSSWLNIYQGKKSKGMGKEHTVSKINTYRWDLKKEE